MEYVLMSHNMRRVGFHLLQCCSKVRIQRGEGVIEKHKHTNLAAICGMIGNVLLLKNV